MREINISAVIAAKRRAKGITQDELAEYMGVSKASVSKWETAQSYPDITLLPRLAAYFNISIDELIGYLPQMTRQDIKAKYNQLAHDFGCKSFNEVYQECHNLIQKYYACFPLVFEMAALLLNHYVLEPDKSRQEEILQEAAGLCEHIKSESDDLWLAKQANSLQAVILMILQKPLEVLELLEETIKPVLSDEVVLANAYQMRGDSRQAKLVLQVSIYQLLIKLVSQAPSYLSILQSDQERFEVSLNRFLGIAGVFELDHLRPDLLASIYYIAALAFAQRQDPEKTLAMISSFTQACTSANFAIALHGDSFFDHLDEWLTEYDLNTSVPRDIAVIRRDALKLIRENPAFAFLSDQPTYQKIIHDFEFKLNGGTVLCKP